MKKENNLNKILVIFLMTCFSMHIFILNLKIPVADFTKNINPIYKFYLSLWMSMEEFDIIWIILLIFIYYYFYNNYFIDKKWTSIKTISCIISLILSIAIIVLTSFNYYKNLSMIYQSFEQVFKCSMVFIGYYFIIYIITRNILLILTNRRKNEKKATK